LASAEYASPWHTVSAIATPDHIWDELSDDYQELLSPEEAHRAIYIDFEGSQDQEPALLGSLWAYGKTPTDDKLRCVHDIHHPSLKPVVGAVELSADDLKDYQQRFRSVEQSLNALLLLAQAQNRLVVSWSPHEFVKVVEHGLSADLFALFQRTYRDGKATAMAWLEQEERSVAKGSNTLVHYLDATGYPIPEEYGLRKTTKRLNSVINGVKKKGSYEALIASQKKNWENLLIHNFTDCHGLRHVTKFASAALP
jgi:hypothetical protein